MTKLLIPLLIASLEVTTSSAFGADSVATPLDIVVDLDSVILDEFAGDPKAPSESQVIFAGRYWSVAAGSGEFLQVLTQRFGARITFYSFGHHDARNIPALKQIILPNGKSALEIAAHIFSREYSVNAVTGAAKIDLKDPSVFQPEWRGPLNPLMGDTTFEGESKKDLRRIPGIDLSHTILIDDSPSVVVRGQEKNFLWLRDPWPRDRHRKIDERLAEISNDPEAFEEAARDFIHDRNRLSFVLGLLQTAMDKAKAEKISLPNALWSLQWKINSDKLRYNGDLRNSAPFYQRGQSLLQELRPSFQIQLPKSCDRILQAIGF